MVTSVGRKEGRMEGRKEGGNNIINHVLNIITFRGVDDTGASPWRTVGEELQSGGRLPTGGQEHFPQDAVPTTRLESLLCDCNGLPVVVPCLVRL